jgi:hypothetical protein
MPAVARALVILSCLLLAVPGLFIVAKGGATIRRRAVYVQGRWEPGPRAVLAGAGLVVYGLVMISMGWMLLRASGLVG